VSRSPDDERAPSAPGAPASNSTSAKERDGRRPLDGGSFLCSVSIHAVALALLWLGPALRDPPVKYQVVRVEVYSPPPLPAPPAEEEIPPSEPEDELVVETPEEQPPDPDPEQATTEPAELPPEEAPTEEESPDPEPADTETADPDPVDTPPPPADEVIPSENTAPVEPEESDEATEDGADINVRQAAFRRDYPEYYANIVVQMRRCFRSPSQSLEATVSFVIRKDGSTAEIGIARSSGSYVFDHQAQEAAECAGRGGRLGPLPDDYPMEVLPILFRFSPRRR